MAITIPLAVVNGIAVDPTHGDFYLLDGDSLQLIRVAAARTGELNHPSFPEFERVTTITLDGEAGALRGLAFDPASRHLFSINPKRRRLIEFTLTGEQVKIYDLSPFNLPEPEALAFAPSTDQTDAPGATSLYITGGGTNGDIWEFTFSQFVTFSMDAAPSSLIQTIEVWQFSPPSPDASGVVYLPGSGTLLETDSEVNEKPIYEGVNQFEMTLSGTLTNTYDTTHFTYEPTGVTFDPHRNHLFFSDDNEREIFETDLNYNLIRSFEAGILDGKAVDPEGVTYNSWNGRLYIAGGISNTIFWIDSGADTIFGTSDDGEGSFPALSIWDPEGIGFNNDTGNLYVVGKKDFVAEYTTAGSLVQLIDISAPNPVKPAGLAYGPASLGDGKSIYVSDRGVDEDSHINGGLGDGKIYEFKIGPPPPPKADFLGSPRSGPAPLSVTFTNLTTSFYDTCEWDFGDGSTSSDCNDPAHTYNNVGTYTVTLSVDGSLGGDSSTKSNYIEVGVQANADFSASPTTGLAPTAVAFVNESSGDYDTCHWDFGDGGTGESCAAIVNHTYSIGGQFTVSLTVSGLGGESTETKAGYITMHAAPTADFSALPSQGRAPLLVQFTNQSSGDFDTCHWDFGDGSSSNECANLSHIYATSGTYTVELSLDGPYGSDSIRKIDHISVGPPAVWLSLIMGD